MEIRIEWSELSHRQLSKIFDYYSIYASPIIAEKIVTRIVERVEILIDNPYLGPREELLKEMPEEFRYLVESNYKIIYWMEEEVITFASVFDCRQNPVKIKKI